MTHTTYLGLLALIFSALALIIVSCKSNKVSIEEPASEISIEDQAREVMGKGVLISPNQDSTMYLCTLEDVPVSYYCVIHESGEVILEKKGVRGKVAWYKKESLKITKTPGRVESKIKEEIIHLKRGI